MFIFTPLVLMTLLCCVHTWTKLDRPFTYQCKSGYGIRYIASKHHNGAEDRQFNFGCKLIGSYSTNQCHWTSWINDWDTPVNFRCPYQGFIAGIGSYHHNGAEDRRYKFKCCASRRVCFHTCYHTAYLNQWDGLMDYNVPPDSVIRGFWSIHSNNAEDRIWKAYICRKKTC